MVRRKSEYDSNGIEFPSFKVRDEQLGEALKIIRPFTRGEKVDFHGKYFSAQMEGHRKQAGKIHLVIGGRARPIIRKAALYADEWNSYLHPPEYLEEAKVILNSARREIQISHMGPFIIAESKAELRNKIRVKCVEQESVRTWSSTRRRSEGGDESWSKQTASGKR